MNPVELIQLIIMSLFTFNLHPDPPTPNFAQPPFEGISSGALGHMKETLFRCYLLHFAHGPTH